MSIDLLNPLIQNLITDLTAELQESDDDFNANLLTSKVKAAVRDVMGARKYPKDYPTNRIIEEMEDLYPTIRHLALYDYDRIGVEGEAFHIENGIHRSYIERNAVFADVLPVART